MGQLHALCPCLQTIDNLPRPAGKSRALGVNHARFDLMLVDGHPFLPEFNILSRNDALTQAGIDIKPLILS